jgi:hypothetical protein
MNTDINPNKPIPFALTELAELELDADKPIPYRIRVSTPSPEMRGYVVPRHDVPTFSEPPVPEERPSHTRLVAADPYAPAQVSVG